MITGGLPVAGTAQVDAVVVNDSTDHVEGAQPFGGAAGTRTGWRRVGGLQHLRDMTDTRCLILGRNATGSPSSARM